MSKRVKRRPEYDKPGWEAWEHDDGSLYIHPAISEETIKEVAAVARADRVREATRWMDYINYISIDVYTMGKKRTISPSHELKNAIIDELRKDALREVGLSEES